MKIRNFMFLVMGGVIIIVTVGFTFFFYQIQRHSLETSIDHELLNAAIMAKEILPDQYHDRITDLDSVSDEEYLQIVDRFNTICQQTGLEYVWSVMLLDGKTVFTSATSPGKDANKQDQAGFFELHTNPDAYTRTFETMQPQYQIIEDKWGRIRAALVPFFDSQGRKYLVGASRRVEDIDTQLRTVLNTSLLLGGGVFILGMIISYILANSLTRPMDTLNKAASKITSGDYSDISVISTQKYTCMEVANLAAQFNLMRQAIHAREENIRKSEEQFRILTESIKDVIWILDCETMRFRYVSPSVEQMRGYTPEEVLSGSVPQALTAEAASELGDRVRTRVKDFLSGKEPPDKFYTDEVEQPCKDGSTVWVDVITSYYINPENNHLEVRGIARDITERKRAEEMLRESNEKFSMLFHQSQIGMGLSTLKEGRYIDVNSEFQRLTEYTREEVIGHTVRDLNIWAFPEQREQAIDILQSNQALRSYEMTIRTKSGKMITTVCSADIIMLQNEPCLFVSVLDITERKQMEEALRESELHFSHLLQDVQSVSIQGYGADGITRYWNQASEKLYGYRAEEAIGRNLLELIIPPEMRKDVEQAIRQMAETGQPIPSSELSLMRKDGSRVPVFSSHTIVQPPGREPELFCIDIDLTERRQVEEALRASEQNFREIFDSTNEAIFIDDAGTGQMIDVNKTMLDIYGYENKDEVLAGTIGDLSANDPPYTDDRAQELVRKAIEEGPQVFEWLAKRRDGSKFWVEISLRKSQIGGKDRVLAVARDITERKQLEVALNQEKTLTDAIFNSIPGILYLYDARGDLLRWNKKHEEMTGYTAEELDHFNIYDWHKGLPEDIEKVRRGFEKTISEGFASYEAALMTKKGSRILVDYTAVRLVIGDQTYITGTGIDITDRRKAEMQIQADQVELKRLLKEAEQSRRTLLSLAEDQKEAEEKIRSLNAGLEKRVADRTAQLTATNQELEAFSYSVSHDLRAPLRALDGFSAILMEDHYEQLDQNARHYLLRIQEASRRMSQLINDLLNLSRITRSDFTHQDVNLSLTAKHIAQELTVQFPQRKLEFEIADHMIVQGDGSLLKIVLENLLNNAVKFTSQREQASIQVGVVQQENKQVYFVRDNGAGFNMDYANKLFIPFQRLHGAQEFSGTGIGLTIVQRIITRHGGRIWAEAAVDQGATFYFTIGESES